MSLFACGCANRDEHHEPEVEWIGNTPISHGSSDHYDADGDPSCLCGHPNYMSCAAYLSGEDSVSTLTLTIEDERDRGTGA